MSFAFEFDSGDYAGLVPGAVVAVVLALLLCVPVARRLHVGQTMAMLLILSFGIVLSATVTPSRAALTGAATPSPGCDLSRVWVAPMSDYASVSDASLNVLLFVPLGILVGMLPSSRYRLPIIVGAALLPFAVEGAQLLVPLLGRVCQSQDVVDNLIGLLLGLGIGLTGAWIARRGRRRS